METFWICILIVVIIMHHSEWIVVRAMSVLVPLLLNELRETIIEIWPWISDYVT